MKKISKFNSMLLYCFILIPSTIFADTENPWETDDHKPKHDHGPIEAPIDSYLLLLAVFALFLGVFFIYKYNYQKLNTLKSKNVKSKMAFFIQN